MVFDRSSGLLLHISSLPSRGGIGDLGPAAYAFSDFLAAAKQRLWQVLPLGPTGIGNSPYASLSAFAGNPLLISLEKLVDAGWLREESIKGTSQALGQASSVDFAEVAEHKLPLLVEAARNFLDHHDDHHDPEQWRRFESFCSENAAWLDDYAYYSVLRQKFHSTSWNNWPKPLAERNPAAIAALKEEEREGLAIEKAIQFAFDEQWKSLRAYCTARGIRLIGDLAIFVNFDSADVWTHHDLFELNPDLTLTRVAGVPPDYFSSTGQRWGNPLYRWNILEERGFPWWGDRIRRALSLYDAVRLDHFRGFDAYWAIPAADETAENGEWVEAPGAALFASLRERFGELAFIAEDLGLITEEVEALRRQFGFPGMRVLQFGFGNRGAHNYLPHRYEPNTVVYTGTHDNDTTLGWWRNGATAQEKAAVESYLAPEGQDVVWAMIRAAVTSVANTCLFPVQDILGIGSEGRMNTPARRDGNWSWRLAPGALNDVLARKLATLMEVADRDLPPEPGR